MKMFIARKPIFDRNKNVYGYDMLFRAGVKAISDLYQRPAEPVSPDDGSAAPFIFGRLTDGKRGFVHFTRNQLLEALPGRFPSSKVNVVIPASIEIDDEVLSTCRSLNRSGHLLVVDDFALEHHESPLLEFVKIVKVDLAASPVDEQKDLCDKLNGQGLHVLAKNVETHADYEQASELGFTYFAGNFFGRPCAYVEKDISTNKLTYLQVVQEVFKPELSYDEIAKLIEQDVSMAYKLLQSINSAWFGLKYEIRSVKHALVLLGPKEIKRWISVLAVRDMGSDKPYELLLRSLCRAKVAEQVSEFVPGLERRASELFLMGLLSSIDALTDTPMQEVLERLPISPSIAAALVGEQGTFRIVYETIQNYENGDWDAFSTSAATLKLDEEIVPDLFRTALQWGNQVLSGK